MLISSLPNRYAALKVPGIREPDAGTETSVQAGPPPADSAAPDSVFRMIGVLLERGDPAAPSGTATLLRLHPLTLHTFDASAPRGVRPAASGADDSGGVTGGVYKARERIHRGVLIRDY